MHPHALSSNAKEDSSSNLQLNLLSSSLHTLSLASLRELLLSCALENEQVAKHINERLHSQDGVKSPNLENFRFHKSSKASGGDGEEAVPASPSSTISYDVYTENSSNNTNYNGSSNDSNALKQSGEITNNDNSNNYNSSNNEMKPSPMASWNWSYYYYKESSSGATAKHEEVDEAAALVQSRAYYWNDEFQAVSDKIRDVDLYGEEQIYVSMSNLYHDFVHVVETYGKIIISERFLPFAQKSIPPAFYMGGHAGGEKYIVQGILFKFSVDKDRLYGSDHYAAKAAGHDLKSLMQVYKNRPVGLHVPMMCLVDYLGYRLIAMSMLPVDISTLCYGSCDGGTNVHADIPEFNDKMEQLGKTLNLKSHQVGPQSTEIIGPCDIEGHNGRDGKFYLLDFARLFPPEAPILPCTKKNPHLYRLLRPELVKKFSLPLSSDAYTLFGKRGAGVHNKEVKLATEHLLNEKIPRFATILDFQEQKSEVKLRKHPNCYSVEITESRLAEILHREGINLRHLGRLRSYVTSDRWRLSLLHEILTRVIKNVLRAKLRSQMELLKHPGLVLYRQTIVGYLNLIFGNSEESLAYWRGEFSEKIEEFYEEALTLEKRDKCVNMKEKVHLPTLFANVRRRTGMVFSPHCNSGEPNFFDSSNPFQETDLMSFPPKVKQMRIAAYATGTALYLKAKYNTNPTESERLASMAAVQFEAALRSNPDDDMILCSYALLLRLMQRYDDAQAYYKMAIKSNPRSARIKSHYAWFLYRDKMEYDKAEKYYLKTLEINPNHPRTLADYANFLYRVRKDNEKAEQFFLKGVACGDKQAISGYAAFLNFTGRNAEASIYKERSLSAIGALILPDDPTKI